MFHRSGKKGKPPTPDNDIVLDYHDDHAIVADDEDIGPKPPPPLLKGPALAPHAAGKVRLGPRRSMPASKPWRTVVFFGLSGITIIVWLLGLGALAMRSTYLHHEAFRALQTRLETQVLGKDYTEPPQKPKAPGTLVTKAEAVVAELVGRETDRITIPETAPAEMPPVTTEPPLTPEPAPKPKPEPAGGYTVQVAAVATEAEAAREVEALKKKGFDAYSRKIEHQGKQFFRVRVGHLASLEDAHALMKQLAAAGQRDMFATRTNE